jgi:hypothetical protein
MLTQHVRPSNVRFPPLPATNESMRSSGATPRSNGGGRKANRRPLVRLILTDGQGLGVANALAVIEHRDEFAVGAHQRFI